MSLLDQPLCSFSSSATPLEPLLVVDWRGEEAISRPYRFEIKLASLNPLLDDEAMLGQPATLKLTDAKGRTQPYHGIVTEAELLDGDGQYFYFRVVLEPRLALLRQSRGSEIWLDKNLPDLIRALVGSAGLQSEGPGTSGGAADGYDFDIRLAADDLALQESPFTCQFEETSFAFLSRLLEYYGVYYFFEQQDNHEAIVFCGDQRYQPQDAFLLNYRPLDSALEVGSDIAVTRSFNRRLATQPKQVVLQDFSASNAQLQLLTSASIAQASLAADADAAQSQAADSAAAFNGEQWLYGEHFGSNQEGQALAELRAQAAGCRHREFHGQGRAVGLRAGYPMQLLGHLRLPLNTRYLVVEVQHSGSQPLPALGQDPDGSVGDVITRFVAIPGDVQFRPQRLTRKPRVQGLLSAIVDGDDSDQPLLNQNGCYKVIFPFIRSDKPQTRGSAWVRMATLSSGASHGMHFPLLKGSEVLISFIGGDPDRPVITGSVPNSENPNMVNESNATQSGLSTPGGHFMAMEDDPSGRKMKLGAPEGQTLFTMGNARFSGAELSTNDHINFASSSTQQQVGDQYKFIAGSVTGPAKSSASEYKTPAEQLDEAIKQAKANTEAAAEKYKEAKKENLEHPSDTHEESEKSAKENYEKAKSHEEALDAEKERQEQITALLPTKEVMDTKWGNPSVWNWGAKAGWNNARTFTAELNTSVFFYECNAGLTKNEMNLYASKNAVEASAFTAEWKLGICEYEYTNAHKKTTPNDKVTAGNSSLTAVSQTIEVAGVSTTTANFLELQAVSGMYIHIGGEHEIEICPGGIRISSPLPLILDGNVMITGDLTVQGEVVSESMKPIFLAVQDSLNVPAISCGTLRADMITSPGSYVPQLPVLWETPLAAIELANTAFSGACDALEVVMDAAKELAAAASEELEAEEAAETLKSNIALGVLGASVAGGIAGFTAGGLTAKKDE